MSGIDIEKVAAEAEVVAQVSIQAHEDQQRARKFKVEKMDLAKSTQGSKFLWNHNTVETVLLGCSVFINLAGICFQSSRFTGEFGDYFSVQRDTMMIAVIIVIIFSSMYWALVFFSELLIFTKIGKMITKKGLEREKNMGMIYFILGCVWDSLSLMAS